MPMENFTSFDHEPSELTLHIIRTIAHNFPVIANMQNGGALAWN